MTDRTRHSARIPPAVYPRVLPVDPPPSRWTMPTAGPIDESDIVAIGADLEPGTLLTAYRHGLFPMPFDRRRIAWFSPQLRGVIPLDGFHVSRSLQRRLNHFHVSFNTAFTDVMTACADPRRPGAWIDREFISAYTRLHELGWGYSVEVFDPTSGDLVGGVYGLRIDRFFAGESMFHRATDASKVALAHLVEWLRGSGVTLFDVQWTTDHLKSLGAIDLPRDDYIAALRSALDEPGPFG